MKTVIERAKATTPPFFKKLRNLGLLVSATAAAILAAPVTLPATVAAIAGYALMGGSVMSAVSQLTAVEKKPTKKLTPKAK